MSDDNPGFNLDDHLRSPFHKLVVRMIALAQDYIKNEGMDISLDWPIDRIIAAFKRKENVN